MRTFHRIEGVEGVVGVGAGLRHSVAVDRAGRTWGWGAGSRGQLGAGAGRVVRGPRLLEGVEEGAVDARCGQHYSLVRTGRGWRGLGEDKYGQLGACKSAGALSCGWTHVVGLEEGEGRVWGRDNYHQLGGGTGGQSVLEGVVEAVAGSEHCLALTREGRVVAWGWNEHGSCAQEGEENVPRPALVHLPGLAKQIWAGSAHCFAAI